MSAALRRISETGDPVFKAQLDFMDGAERLNTFYYTDAMMYDAYGDMIGKVCLDQITPEEALVELDEMED